MRKAKAEHVKRLYKRLQPEIKGKCHANDEGSILPELPGFINHHFINIIRTEKENNKRCAYAKKWIVFCDAVDYQIICYPYSKAQGGKQIIPSAAPAVPGMELKHDKQIFRQHKHIGVNSVAIGVPNHQQAQRFVAGAYPNEPGEGPEGGRDVAEAQDANEGSYYYRMVEKEYCQVMVMHAG